MKKVDLLRKVSVRLAVMSMVCVMPTLYAYGQDVSSGDISGSKKNHFGIKIGLNLASTTDCSVELNRSTSTIEIEGSETTGFNLGLFDNYSFSKLLGLQVEAMFSIQGDAEDKLSYINIPVLLNLKPVKNLGILVGPQIGLNVAHPDKYNDSYSITGGEIYFDEMFQIDNSNNETAKLDFGIVVGAQYTLVKHLVIGARYNLGLTKIRTFESANVNVSGYANRVIQFSVGWLF